MERGFKPTTVEEFVELIPDGTKADLLDGVIYLASPDSPYSSKVNLFLGSLVLGYAARRGLGDVYGSRSAYRLTKFTAPEPDISFVRKDRLELWKGSYFQGAPDLAVEVVSPDSVDRDNLKKKAAYERAGVGEYWIIDLVQRKCKFLRLRDWKYYAARLERGRIFRSKVLPGFWLDTRWLLHGEPPDPLDCMLKILKIKTVK